MDVCENSKHKFIKMMLETGRLHRSVMEKSLQDLDCSPSQHRMLLILKFSGRKVSQKELSEKMKISKAAVAATLKKLEKKGFVEKKTDEEDNRYNEIVLTNEGLRMLEKTKEVFDKADDLMFSDVTEEEIAATLKCIEKIHGSLVAMNCECGGECGRCCETDKEACVK